MLRKSDFNKVLFFLPFFVFVTAYLIYPLFNTAALGFLSKDGEFVGLANYTRILINSNDLINFSSITKGFPMGALIHNMIWIAIHLPLSVVLGLLLSVVLKSIKGGLAIKSIVFLGMVIPMVVAGVFTRFLFEGNIGIVPKLFQMLGIESLNKSWLAHPDTALFSVILVSLWVWAGFPMIVYSAGLSGIPETYYEAAKIEGASPLQVFFRITLPLLKSATIVVIVMTVLHELKTFDLVYVATFGGPGGASNVLPLQAWLYAFRASDFGRASATATLLTIMIIAVNFFSMRSMVKGAR